jgi:hypothetical protein
MAAMPDVEVPNPFVLMPNILDKLKILDYEAEFAREMMNGELLHSVRTPPFRPPFHLEKAWMEERQGQRE